MAENIGFEPMYIEVTQFLATGTLVEGIGFEPIIRINVHKFYEFTDFTEVTDNIATCDRE
jgi:hypothetical protein